MNNFAKLFLFLGFLTLASSFTLDGANGRKQDLKALPFKDKLMVFLASQIKSKRIEGFPKLELKDLFDDEYWYFSPYVDNFFVDGRQLFTQSKNTAVDAQLAEIDWRFRYSFCIWFFCIDEELSFTTKDSKFIGTDTIKSDTKITPTTIENTFEIRLFNWTSPGFLFNSTDYIRESIWLDQNAFISFENVTIAFFCNYHFVPDVGIQIANLSIHFNPGTVRGWVSDITQWDFHGNLVGVYEPEEYPYDEIMTDTWGYYKRDYTRGLQYSFNCLLSNGRSDPDNCLLDEADYVARDYFRFTNMQLLNTMGLGELLSGN
jgi:hypothetical protein